MNDLGPGETGGERYKWLKEKFWHIAKENIKNDPIHLPDMDAKVYYYVEELN